MDDNKIIELYLERSEQAIEETQTKYGKYCHTIAYNILGSSSDAEECVNDTYLKAWNSIPPTLPRRLSAFLATLTRNIALQKYEYYSAKKRGGNVDTILYELSDAIPVAHIDSETTEEDELKKAINSFLDSLPKKQRVVFMSRYWYAMSIKEISERYSMSESAVKVALLRTRLKLKTHLEGKGINI